MTNKTFAPVNKNASSEAKTLLSYLYSLKGQKIISGHHNYPYTAYGFSEKIRTLTQKQPALWGSDLSRLRGDTRSQVISYATQMHQEGHIITLMWHAARPMDEMPVSWQNHIQGKVTDQQWSELTTPGTPLYQRWEAQVDEMATHLKVLHNQKIPVLWRPYHEMNGIWFWWGNKQGKKGFVRLWKNLYNRLVSHHQLHNLIWVWNPNAPRDRANDEAYAYELFYPGNKFVDVLAADVYHNDYAQSHHDQLLALGKGKLIALGEVGQAPTPETLAAQPHWSWFMIWTEWVDKHNSPDSIRALYNYEKVITLDELETPWK